MFYSGDNTNGLYFIAGVYGVGKSTLCEKISTILDIPFYSSGDLISNINGETYGANKTVKDKAQNQIILVSAVNQLYLRYPAMLLVGHFCIFDKNTKVDILPEDVFAQLKILKIILLEAEEEIIINHLSKRDNKFYSKEQIVELQSIERIQALKIASKLEIPIVIHQMKFDDCDIDEILIKIKED